MIGSILKQLRYNKGYTISQVCVLLDMNQNTYAKYERNERDVSTDILSKLADFYHVTTDYLLGRETKEEAAIDALSYEFDMSLLEKKIVNGYLTLPKDQRENVMDFIVKMVEETHENEVD